MKYELHDCEIDAVILEKDRIIFSFPNGFHVEDENGQTLKKKLAFTIDRECCPNAPPESFLFIRRINRRMNGWKDISFREFTSLFKKGNMVIHDEYDSKMTNWKMIQLNASTRRSNIELFITDIADVECLDDERSTAMLDKTPEDVFAVFDQLKDRYPLEMTNTLALNMGFTIDCPILVGRAHGQILWLYDDGGIFVLDVMDEAQTEGTHWHPCDVEDAAEDIAAFMDGKSDYKLYPF